jgi:hypothetical protein
MLPLARETPPATPLDASTVAMDVALLDHVPPASPLDVSVVVVNWQMGLVLPVVKETTPAFGNGVTVTVLIDMLLQPEVVPVTVYMAVIVGLATGMLPVVADKPVEGDQV